MTDVASAVGFAPEEVTTDASTRSARLKWVVVVDASLPAGRVANAVACTAASTGAGIEGLIARGGPDASGQVHPGLPWTGCSVLAASAAELAELRSKASGAADVFIADMPAAAQSHRIYDGYLSELATTEPDQLGLCAISIVGPRNRVDKWVKRLELLG